MAIWSSEIKELEKLYESFKGHLPELEKELEQLIQTADANVIMLYSRRCLEVIITDICECELKRPRKTEPLKGIIDKLHKEEKVPSNIITSMDHLNSLSAYGAHPKDFDPEQVKPVLVNLGIIIKWYLKYKDFQIVGVTLAKKKKTEFEVKRPGKSILVLPFVNIGSNQEDEYFSDGLTEEIITNLAHIKAIRVISRSTSMVLKGTKKDIKTIGRELDIDYVLEGSVRKSGNRTRITGQLINAASDEHLWAEKYDGTLDDIFDVQEKIATKIVDALQIELSPFEKTALKDRPIKNPKAYDYWILAKNEIIKLNKEGFENAVDLVNKALELEGDNALLYATLGSFYYYAYDFDIIYEPRIFDLMEEYATKSLTLDPNQEMALFVKALICYKHGDLPGFVRLCRSAADQGGDAVPLITFVLAELGKLDEAYAYNEKAFNKDPLIFGTWWALAIVNLLSGNANKAYKMIMEAREKPLAFGEPFVGWWVGQMAVYAGETEAAYSEFRKVAETGFAPWNEFCKLFQLSLESDRKGAMEHLQGSIINEISKTDEMFPLFISNALANVGEYEEALLWLRRSVDWGFSNYKFLTEYNRFFKPLKNNPLFLSIIDQARKQQESFKD